MKNFFRLYMVYYSALLYVSKRFSYGVNMYAFIKYLFLHFVTFSSQSGEMIQESRHSADNSRDSSVNDNEDERSVSTPHI